MTVSRPAELRAGVEIRYRATLHTVLTVNGISVGLVDVAGEVTRVRVAELVADPGFEAPLPRSGILEALPAMTREDALWWERHIVEVLTGHRPDSPPQASRPGYDLASTTLRQRELAKVDELRADDQDVPYGWVGRRTPVRPRDLLVAVAVTWRRMPRLWFGSWCRALDAPRRCGPCCERSGNR